MLISERAGNGSTYTQYIKTRIVSGLFYISIIGADTMGKLVYTYKEFIVIEDDYKDGHIIINTFGKYHNHGHVKYLGTCKKFLKLMDKGIVPDSPYLRGTALRVSLDSKYRNKVLHKIEKDKNKPHYININKGVRK